jgi:hypothetical protein
MLDRICLSMNMPLEAGKQVEAAKEATEKLEPRIVNINRAPTLTLWVKVVAEREGFVLPA